jgi:NAD(P)-dependent dehydrogenase (short-subunit alcohol dehydrogenase family)
MNEAAGEPIEVAEAVLWVCSPAASFMTGQSLVLDGGFLAGPNVPPEEPPERSK